MSIGRCFVIGLIVTIPLTASTDRTSKYAPVLESPEVMLAMETMVDEATRIQKDSEIAAFLVINLEGRFELRRWDNSEVSRRQSFTGKIPPRTVGIVHTHPNEWARPSAGDRKEAKRIGLPIYVVTRWDIWVAEPDGSILPLIENADWRDDLERFRNEPLALSISN